MNNRINILLWISVSVTLVFALEVVQISAASKMQILLMLAAKQALFPSGFKLFEDANFVPSCFLANEADGALP